MRNWKRLISVMLALVLVSTMFTGLALAATTEKTPVNVPFEKVEVDKDSKEQEYSTDVWRVGLTGYVTTTEKPVTIDPEKEYKVPDSLDWSSSATAVGYVDTEGYFYPQKAGTATVTVSSHMDKTVKDTFTITVKAKPVVTGITFNDSSFEVEVGGSSLNLFKFAKLQPEDKTFYPWDYTLTMKSSEPDVVTTDYDWDSYSEQYWNVSGKKAGTATVTVTITNKDGTSASATANITVTENSLQSLSFSKSSITINKFEKTSVDLSDYLTKSPANAMNSSLKWESSNEEVATVSGGTVSARRPGTATITVKSVTNPEISASIDIVVVESEAINEVKFDENTIVLYYVEKPGKDRDASNTQTVYLNIQPAAAADTIKTVTWRTSNAKVAIPHGDTYYGGSYITYGVQVEAVGKGRCTISCTFKDTSGKEYSASFKVKVTDKSPTAKLSKKAVTLKVKKSVKLSAKDADKGTKLQGKWKSSDKKVAKVNSKGKVTAVNPGRAIITFTPKNKAMKKVTCVVTVTK